MFPKVLADVEAIAHNARTLCELASSHCVGITPVVKSVAGFRPVIEAVLKENRRVGSNALADSNLAHIRQYRDLDADVWFIREPMVSEIPELVPLTSLALVSERATIDAINEYCSVHGGSYRVVLMAELGDLREGCDEAELLELSQYTESLAHVELAGIGVNFSCYGNILPSCSNMGDLSSHAYRIQELLGRELEIVSGGNSSSLRMLFDGELPSAVTNLRCGESIMLGRLPCYEEDLPNFRQGTMVLEAQIVELKEKPSLPWGESGNGDAFGEIPQFIDKGRRKRALVAVGKQTLYLDGLVPCDPGVELLGGASDYMVCDVTESSEPYEVGSVLRFQCDYPAFSSGFAHIALERGVATSQPHNLS